MILLTPAQFSDERARGFHPYTVTENHGILAAEFPLQRQDGNERPHH
jgi:uncharacterized membrane protein